MFRANPPGVTEMLRSKRVLIAGAGGLGSNAAMLLVRAGLTQLTVIDFDTVSLSNLNRQFYFRDQIGSLKVQALRDNLIRIVPDCRIESVSVRLEAKNFSQWIPEEGLDLVLECLDTSESKAELVGFMLAHRPELPVIAVSGIGGVGPLDEIREIPGPGALTLIGDRVSDATLCGTLSSRVMAAAAAQVHCAIRILANPELAFLPPPGTF